MKRKIYIETSVISYLTARPSKTIIGAAHQQITASWWETRQQYDLFVSAPVLRECQAGDKSAAAKRMAALEGFSVLQVSQESLSIAESLVQHGIIPPKASEDALHIAIATVSEMEFLLTWNCKHIANPIIQKRIEDYLDSIGKWLPFICTPEELLGDENDE